MSKFCVRVLAAASLATISIGCNDGKSTVYNNGNGTVTEVTRSSNPLTNTSVQQTVRHASQSDYNSAHQNDALKRAGIGILKWATGMK